MSVGKICASRAAAGKVGKFSVAVCVLIITWPSGSATEMPLTAGLMLSNTEISDRAIKFSVVPVSALIEWINQKRNVVELNFD